MALSPVREDVRIDEYEATLIDDDASSLALDVLALQTIDEEALAENLELLASGTSFAVSCSSCGGGPSC